MASWAIDGLEVTLKGAVSGVLQDPGTLGLSSTEIGFAASCYLLGAVVGALFCGHLTDRHGRADGIDVDGNPVGDSCAAGPSHRSLG